MAKIPDPIFASTEIGHVIETIPTVEEHFGLNGAGKKPPPVLDCVAMAEPLPEIPYLVRELGMVGGGGAPDLFAGYGFSGKTIALQAMLLAMAAEQPVWDAWTAPRSLRVVHVDLEQGKRLTTRRYQRLAAGMGIDLRGYGDRLILSSEGSMSAFKDDDQWLDLMAGRQLMVVDSLRALNPSTDENDSRIRESLDWLGVMSGKTGCRVAVIHHARKQSLEGGEAKHSIRGSGAIYDGVDGAWVFSAAKNEPVKVEHVKARSHGDLIEDFSLVISDVALSDPDEPKGGLRLKVFGRELVDQIRDKRAMEAEKRKTQGRAKTILAVVKAQPGLSARELRSQCGMNGTNWASAVEEASQDLDIRDEKVGRTIVRRYFSRVD